MTKAEFIKAVHEEVQNEVEGGVSASISEAYVNAVFNQITEVMKNGDHVTIPNFGKFGVVFRKGRSGIAPGSGKPYQSPDKYAPKFSPSETLMKTVAESVPVK